MKTLKLLGQQIRQQYQHWQEQWWTKDGLLAEPSPIQGKLRLNQGFHPPVVLVVAVVYLTSVIGYRFYDEPKLDVGTIAPQTIKAPASVSLEDIKTTAEKRKEARSGSVPVLMIDQSVNQQINQELRKFLSRGNELRQTAGPFPFVEVSALSHSTQLYLRKAEEREWLMILQALNSNPAVVWSGSSNTSAALRLQGGPVVPNSVRLRALTELQNYRRMVSPDSFSTLLQTISKARWQYTLALKSLNDPSVVEPENLYDASVLDWPDSLWHKQQVTLEQVTARILTQGIHPGVPKDILSQTIKLQLSSTVPAVAEPLATKFLLSVLEPNLVKDPEQTKLRAEQAANAVEPVLVSVKRGDVIVKAGEKIIQADFVLLDHFGLSRREINWLGLIGFSTVISGMIGIFWVMKRQFHPEFRQRDYYLILLLTLSAPLPVILGIDSTCLPAIGLLMGSFYGSALGVTVVGLLSAVLPLGIDITASHLVANAAGGLLGGLLAGRLRSREELALLGGLVGLVQGIVYLLLTTAIGPAWYVLLGSAALQGLAGLAWSVVALGVSPYLEHVFDLVTPIRLSELANPNRPLLKRLAAEAPGTFQHTLFVATLAEAAAKALGCNVELVRAGTLYHDIGKMHDPQGFIENQMGGPNKHDTIDNPWKSAEIIKKHVSEGLVMARKYRLPGAIQAFIPEHQGTMLIVYFYHQAQQKAAQEPDAVINEMNFRYDGPVPQSRETGIVMLADACEAALRSLKTPCPEEALVMLKKIFKARWQDQQLVDSGLTREDLNQIASIFIQVWQQFNHQRIAYPKAVLPAK